MQQGGAKKKYLKIVSILIFFRPFFFVRKRREEKITKKISVYKKKIASYILVRKTSFFPLYRLPYYVCFYRTQTRKCTQSANKQIKAYIYVYYKRVCVCV